MQGGFAEWEQWCSSSHTTRASWALEPRNRVGVSGWKITERKHQGYGEEFWLSPSNGNLAKDRPELDQTSLGEGWRVTNLVRH